VTVCSLRDV